ncbi:hypothetical protein [Marinoscillum pacificum]|uniref:hypothetical protein n=1 Tax=Marinoscillum pacificum TaxID=392723 RepID=UPI0021578D90|nr:hypothetical protein [Marinoscillum pacificum]
MKAIKFLFFLSISVFVALTGCKDPNAIEDPIPAAPSMIVTVNGNQSVSQITLDPGDTLIYSVETNVPAGISNFKATYILDEVTYNVNSFTPDTTVTAYTLNNRQLYLDYTLAGKELTFSFTVTDNVDSVATYEFVLNVNESPITERLDIVVSPYNQFVKGNLYDVAGDTTYFPINVKTNESNQLGVDLIFAYNATDGYSVSSPSDVDAVGVWDTEVSFNWPFLAVSSTKLAEVNNSAVTYEQIVTATQLNDLIESSTATSIKGLHVGQLIAIKLDAEKGGVVGLIQITNIVGTKDTERQITFNLKQEL